MSLPDTDRAAVFLAGVGAAPFYLRQGDNDALVGYLKITRPWWSGISHHLYLVVIEANVLVPANIQALQSETLDVLTGKFSAIWGRHDTVIFALIVLTEMADSDVAKKIVRDGTFMIELIQLRALVVDLDKKISFASERWPRSPDSSWARRKTLRLVSRFLSNS